MPRAPLPPELEHFVATPRRAVVATVRADGAPVTAATWYDWVDGRVVLTMDADGLRARSLRRDPRVALTVLGDDWYAHVSLIGRAVEIRDDPDLVEIDRMSIRYDGVPYDRRDVPSVTAIVEIDRWHAWGDPGAEPARAPG